MGSIDHFPGDNWLCKHSSYTAYRNTTTLSWQRKKILIWSKARDSVDHDILTQVDKHYESLGQVQSFGDTSHWTLMKAASRKRPIMVYTKIYLQVFHRS